MLQWAERWPVSAGGNMNFTILVALVAAGAVVLGLAKILVHSIARKGQRAAETTR